MAAPRELQVFDDASGQSQLNESGAADAVELTFSGRAQLVFNTPRGRAPRAGGVRNPATALAHQIPSRPETVAAARAAVAKIAD